MEFYSIHKVSWSFILTLWMILGRNDYIKFENSLGVLIRLIIVMSNLLVLMISKGAHHPEKISHILGIFLLIAGLSLSIWARLILGLSWSAFSKVNEEKKLIMKGPYRIIRHPIYVGFFIAFLGTSIEAQNIIIWGSFFLLSILYFYKIKAEEKALLQTHGEDYERYKISTWF